MVGSAGDVVGPRHAGAGPGARRRALAFVVLVSGPILGACAGSEATVTPPAAARAAVVRGTFEKELLLTGELEAVRSISIKSPQTSLFQMRIQFMAEEGSFVRRGEPILEFDSSSLGATVLELETRILDAETQIVAKRNEMAGSLKDLEIELAEKEFNHGRAKLDASIDPEVVSERDFAERQLAASSAERELAETRERVELTRQRGQAELDVLVINRDKLQRDLLTTRYELELLAIKAPADGLVLYERREGTTLRFQEGDSCWPGQGVMQLPDLQEMRVVFGVNEVDAPLLAPGMPVVVSLDAFPGRELLGTIRMIPSMAVKRDEQSKIAVFKVRADLAETWVGEMKPGMSALGRVVVDRRDDVPLVPRHAVSFDGTDYWLEGAEPGAPRRRVTPVARNGTHYVLSEEDYVAATAAAKEREA